MQHHSPRAAAAVLAVGVLVLAGCGSEERATDSTSATSSPGDVDKYTPAPPGSVSEDSGETIEPDPAPEWDDAEREDARKSAEEAMRAFARRGAEHTEWWDRLSPLLTQTAQRDYVYVDPANIPASKVTGAGKIVDESGSYSVNVDVPTDVGTYRLILTRQKGSDPWKVARFTPPEDLR